MPTTNTAPASVTHLVRRQFAYIPLNATLTKGANTITFGKPTAANATGTSWPLATFSLYALRSQTVDVISPLAEQIRGNPRTQSDLGTYLEALPEAPAADNERAFTISADVPLYLRVEVPASLEPLVYTVPYVITAGRNTTSHTLTIDVADISLLTDPRIHAIATTTTDALARLLPDSFGSINPIYLDRGDESHAPAIAAFDLLMRAARREGITLVVEDIAPAVRVDDVGRVTLDWEAYDRTMSPYLDGTAFADRLAQPIWITPQPPRRIRESPIQLRQFLQQCIEHHQARGWIGVPAILHTALAVPDENAEQAAQLRDTIARTVKLHVGRDVLVICTPDVTLPHTPMWVVDDNDTRFPPAGALADAYSVRAWPWMCAARGVQGLVWRDAIAEAGTRSPQRALFALSANKDKSPIVHPTARLASLVDGLQDVNVVGLLEKRGDPLLAREILAGVAGRTGTALTQPANAAVVAPPGGLGFLYAGWPTDNASWTALPPLLQRFVLANEPGKKNLLPPDDPQLLAARLWVARARRPAARITGYDFALTPGRDGTVLTTTAHLAVENPVAMAASVRYKIEELPGDFLLNPGSTNESAIDPFAATLASFTATGRLDSIIATPKSMELTLSERVNGATLNLNIPVPIHRARLTNLPIKIDGKNEDWPLDNRVLSYGPMRINKRFANRPDLLAGAVRDVEQSATAQWTFDADTLYAHIRVPQSVIREERNNEWPLAPMQGDTQRWFGSDGVQLFITGGTTIGDKAQARIINIGIKPSGVALSRTLLIGNNKPLKIEDAPAGLRYAVSSEAGGYAVELAIPRKWFGDRDKNIPAWRINIITHRHDNTSSTSWSGPLVSDADVAMMGLLIGSE